MANPTMQGDSNIAVHILLESAHEILGERKLLPSFDPENGNNIGSSNVEMVLQALQDDFGVLGSRGLALRMGRAAFKYGLKYLGDQNGFRTTEFRLLPAPRRLETGLHTLAHIVSEMFHQPVTVADEHSFWIWRVEHTRGNPQSELNCYWMTGLLQAFLTWAGGGRFFQVVETECWSSGGPACVFKIEKRPLD